MLQSLWGWTRRSQTQVKCWELKLKGEHIVENWNWQKNKWYEKDTVRNINHDICLRHRFVRFPICTKFSKAQNLFASLKDWLLQPVFLTKWFIWNELQFIYLILSNAFKSKAIYSLETMTLQEKNSSWVMSDAYYKVLSAFINGWRTANLPCLNMLGSKKEEPHKDICQGTTWCRCCWSPRTRRRTARR